jgi:hypothetical protein
MLSNGLEPMPQTSEALIARYLNVGQYKLGTIVIQSQAHCARDDLCMGNQFYFQIT